MIGSLRRLVARLVALFRRSRLDRDFDAEIDAHLDLAVEELTRSGLTPDEARRRALVRLGGREPARDLHRDTRGLPAMERLAIDLRDTWRSLRRAPMFTAIAVTVLAIGIGANTMVFSLVNGLLLRPLPFPAAERLVWMTNHYPGSESSGLSGQSSRVIVFENWRERSRTVEEMTAFHAFYGYGTQRLTGGGDPERLVGVPVADNFFSFFGAPPSPGRGFTTQETTPNGPPAVVISHRLWLARFEARSDVVGSRVEINGVPTTIVGVAPPTFDFGSIFSPGTRADLFLPLRLDDVRTHGNALAVIGRLRADVSLEEARAEFEALIPAMQRDMPEEGTSYGARLTPLAEHVSGAHRRPLTFLWMAVVAVLLLISVNLASLMLSRAATRRREMAVRSALGAGRRRMIGQLLTESLALGLAGATMGLGVAWAALRSIAASRLVELPLLDHVSIDAASVALTVTLGVGTALVIGLLPALQLSSSSVPAALKDEARGSTAGRGSRLAHAVLVTAEIALAVVLLVGAALLARILAHVLDVDLGFDPAGSAIVRVDAPADLTGAERAQFFDRLLAGVRALPGVTAAGISDALPMSNNRTWSVRRPGQVLAPGETQNAFVRIVSPGYLEAMAIRLVAGRDFDGRDAGGAPPTMIVNETLARILWPDRDPIGQLVSVGQDFTVVGVVGDVRHAGPERPVDAEMYLSLMQFPGASADLAIRSALPIASLAPAVHAALARVDPQLPTSDFRAARTLVDRVVAPRRFLATLVVLFAGIALVVASLGIYGVVANGVAQRTQEIGIRLALGSTAWGVWWGVVASTLKMAALGAAFGAAGALAAGSVISALLFGVSAYDPMTYAGVALLVVGVAATAAAGPARRAVRIDPLRAMRAL